MTHDELLAKIENTLGAYISKCYGSKKDVELRSDVIDSLQALRAVVELHSPMESASISGEPIVMCSGCYEEESSHSDYPCPTDSGGSTGKDIQMTCDELLVKIDNELVAHGQKGNIVKHSFALRSVVELHTGKGVKNRCVSCSHGSKCETIKVIEKELL